MAHIETDATKLVALLKKKQRASAAELGTTPAIMGALAKAEVVKKDGFIKTGTRGRPPAAWVLIDADVSNGDLPDVTPQPKPRLRNGEGVSQNAVDAAVRDVLENSPHGDRCSCLKVGQTAAELRGLNAGCTGLPHDLDINEHWAQSRRYYVCPALDSVRRRIGA